MSYNPLEFGDQAKVWVYQADRKLLDEEVERMQPLVDAFCRQWTAHKQQLKAGGAFLKNRFLLLAVDERDAEASGCSIDRSVYFLKELQSEFGLNWFNRLDVAFEQINGEIQTVPLAHFELMLNSKTVNKDTLVYNHAIQDLGSWRNSWRKPLAESWLAPRYQRWNAEKNQTV